MYEMPVGLQQCEELPVSFEDVELLWKRVREETGAGDDEVTVKCVSEEEIRKLNQKYRGIDKSTNGLTFSYGDGRHDIALSLEVAEREAEQRGLDWSDYAAWLVVHALLHAGGMDHARSGEAEEKTREAEKRILRTSGFRELE